MEHTRVAQMVSTQWHILQILRHGNGGTMSKLTHMYSAPYVTETKSLEGTCDHGVKSGRKSVYDAARQYHGDGGFVYPLYTIKGYRKTTTKKAVVKTGWCTELGENHPFYRNLHRSRRTRGRHGCRI